MKKTDILELKRRFKKNECTFTKMSGCYVNSDKEQVLTFTETFLNLEDEEFYKYLDIAKKVLSGTLGNNLLELEFPMEDELEGHYQQYLNGLKQSRLENSELMDVLFSRIIEKYDYVGNYLILLFHDTYDVMVKTSDQNKLDESEEVFEYIICAVCPVELSKAGLGYLADENRIGPRIRDWVVSAPENGFLFPCFTDRSTDIHSCLYYTKNPKDSHPEFMESVLGCPSIRTAHEKKMAFCDIVKSTMPDEDKADELLLEVQTGIHDLLTLKEDENNPAAEPIMLTKETIEEVLDIVDIPEEICTKIERSVEEEFGTTPPAAEQLLDNKTITLCEQHKKEKELKTQVSNLTKQLNNRKEDGKIFLTVSEQKVDQIKEDLVDGRRCLIIPLDEDDVTTINGETLS